jgi:hypothetical protein
MVVTGMILQAITVAGCNLILVGKTALVDSAHKIGGGVKISTAKEEIRVFLASNEVGVKTSFKRTTLLKAAEDMFTAQGLPCPVFVTERNGETYLINRNALSDT